MIYSEFEINGFKKIGNWYIKDTISINLFTKKLKESKFKLEIDFKKLDNLTLTKLDNLINALNAF